MSLEQIAANLTKKIREIEGATVTGLYKAGLMIEREAIERTPKATGNLRNSFKTIRHEKDVEIKNTANYAMKVHEDLQARHKVGQAKYLENAIKAKEADALKIIAENARKSV